VAQLLSLVDPIIFGMLVDSGNFYSLTEER
jgi:hypothetical protein